MSFRYDNSSEMIFENINLHFHTGWSGIIGENGSGKSTMLKLASKKLCPTAGTVTSEGKLYYCDQRTDEKPEGFQSFADSWDNHSFKIQHLLGIDPLWFSRWKTLSHGERKRCQIAVALFFQPDILIIDEPTNHIDIECRKILIDSLEKFKGIGIIVSHDRELLNRLCSKIISIENRTFQVIAGNYAAYEKEVEKKYKNMVGEKEKLGREIKKLEKEAVKRKMKASGADKKLSKSSISSKDHDSKSKIDSARLTGKDAVDGRKYSVLKGKINKMISQRLDIGSTAKRELGIKLHSKPSEKSNVLFMQAGIIKLGENNKLEFPDLYINRGEKIGLIGKNGSGKSSLIRKIVDSIKISASIAYIPQEISLQESELLFSRVLRHSNNLKGQIFTIISRLNSDPKMLFESESLSPGETRKLMLASALINRKKFIIMDEPTNHMDLPSIQCVERALSEFGGALLLVSHDTEFLLSIVDNVWKIEQSDHQTYKLEI